MTEQEIHDRTVLETLIEIVGNTGGQPETVESLKRSLTRLDVVTDYLERETVKWDDREDDMSAAIKESHPVHTGDHASYQRAMELVGNRYSKFALVALVNHLLRLSNTTKPA